MDYQLRIKNGLLAMGLQATDDLCEKLHLFINLLQKWNQAFNLTAIKDPDDMLSLHLFDSLAIAKLIHDNTILDVGTGAGLPGIPLALYYPDKQFVLLDSNSKKTRFITQVVHELNINNIEVVKERIEAYNPRHDFANIVSRAFTSLEKFVELTSRLCSHNGQILAMKADAAQQPALQTNMDWQIAEIVALQIPELAAKRCAVIIKKAM